MLTLKAHTGRLSPIGIDMGATGVRAAQVIARGGVYTLIDAARWERRPTDTPRGAKPAGPATPARGAATPDPGGQAECDEQSAPVSDGLLQCLGQGTFRGRRVVTGLSAPDIGFHALELPESVLSQAPSEASQVVRWEVQRLLSDPSQAVEIRHWGLPSTRASAPNAMGVAAPSVAVARALAACEGAGLRCLCLDTAATALARFGSVLKHWESEDVWGVLDVGARQTRLVLCVDEVPALVRTAGSGGIGWTERIAESLQITTKAAEIHKRDCGMAVMGRGVRPETAPPDDSTACPIDTAGGPNRDAAPASWVARPTSELGSILLGCLRGDLTALAAEIKRSYEFVLGCYPGRQAADLILVGGGAAMRNLPEFLAGALGIPVRRGSSYVQEPSSRMRWEAPATGEPPATGQPACGGRARCGRFTGAVDQRASVELHALAMGLAIGHGKGP